MVWYRMGLKVLSLNRLKERFLVNVTFAVIFNQNGLLRLTKLLKPLRPETPHVCIFHENCNLFLISYKANRESTLLKYL